VAVSANLEQVLFRHLIRSDGQEDLVFALWTPSVGTRRRTAALNRVRLPEAGDRQVHGNVSFNSQYLERVCREASAEGLGVAFLHSHPAPGWQGMSPDDIAAETTMSTIAQVLTNLPLVGLTCGNDGTWSARFWPEEGKMRWCQSVRSVGTTLRISFNDKLVPQPKFRDLFRRTATVWGAENHRNLARLRIGIVGLGSVGSFVAESLARMGLNCFTLIDFDEVQPHNLDRLLGASEKDIGALKVEVAARQIKLAATAASIEVVTIPCSIAEEEGYRGALDCDVIFSCVDRPRARSILNHFAYAHLIPVIDGGIQVRFKGGTLTGADWQLQTVGPGRPCLQCLGAFSPSDVDTEKAGLLDDPSYLAGLPTTHHVKQNENVFPFSANLASLEVFQLIALITGAAGMTDFGVQRFRYMPGHLESDQGARCNPHCFNPALVGRADHDFTLVGLDLTAAAASARRMSSSCGQKRKAQSQKARHRTRSS
jgi:molybdopterin/thiamine biosynthesis adenylyltransferase